MKRFVIFAITVAAALLLVLILSRERSDKADTHDPSEVGTPTVLPDTHTAGQPNATTTETNPPTAVLESAGVATNQDDQFLQLLRRADEAGNIPVAFFGLVVDQDGNALQNVSVDLEVVEHYSEPLPDGTRKRTRFQKQTAADGRFEVSGLKGKYIGVYTLTKEGYEQEFPGRFCGAFGPQSTSFDNPGVLNMWSTNVHEPLITGEKSFNLVPDGRHYGIDLTKGTIAEGKDGDLVVWIRRPELVEPPQKYAWSCELVAPGGGLEPESNLRSPMYRAPLGDYTNSFTFSVEYNTRARDGMSLDNRFYFRLPNGQYGRLSVNFWTHYRKDPTFGRIGLSYALNPSGSRLLR